MTKNQGPISQTSWLDISQQTREKKNIIETWEKTWYIRNLTKRKIQSLLETSNAHLQYTIGRKYNILILAMTRW